MSAARTDPTARLVDRRVLAALRRLHRREPTKRDHRVDTVVAEVRSDPGERRPVGHRGSGSLAGLTDAELRAHVDRLVEDGRLAREGHRIRLTDHEAGIEDAQMRARVDRLLDGLRELGAAVPRTEPIAARLGIPTPLLEQLRASGELVQVADGIDYPGDVLASIGTYLDEAARHGPLRLARVRDELRVSRRHAEALIAWHATRGGGSHRGPSRRSAGRRRPADRDSRGVG